MSDLSFPSTYYAILFAAFSLTVHRCTVIFNDLHHMVQLFKLVVTLQLLYQNTTRFCFGREPCHYGDYVELHASDTQRQLQVIIRLFST